MSTADFLSERNEAYASQLRAQPLSVPQIHSITSAKAADTEPVDVPLPDDEDDSNLMVPEVEPSIKVPEMDWKIVVAVSAGMVVLAGLGLVVIGGGSDARAESSLPRSKPEMPKPPTETLINRTLTFT